ncbi:hypothetical protein QO010_002153 [Caulobacter ginsengisoli]|uniref:Uncharacterized protein n=1 Tax=Caulobacter ginsengisoli TaxID=400775 RepID=A0ABU0ITT0_9CAUL|nr:hypothetical protein [Caulobacter ginsengisoli]MDQ0464372.1 hypothetical protein [Caulobacter ginsengisoli]
MPALESRPALVARSPVRPSDPELFLQLGPEGTPLWTQDPAIATRFGSMREAAREAFRLPAAVRAFGVPLVLH